MYCYCYEIKLNLVLQNVTSISFAQSTKILHSKKSY